MTSLLTSTLIFPAGAAASLLAVRLLLARAGRPPPCTVPYAVVAGWLVAAGAQGVRLLAWPLEPLGAIGLGGLLAAFSAAAVRSIGGRAQQVGLPLLATLPPLLGAASLLPTAPGAALDGLLLALLPAAGGALAFVALERQAERLPPRARPLPSALWLGAVAAAALAHGSLSMGAVFAGGATAAGLVVLATLARLAPPSAFPTVAAALAAGGGWAAWRLAAMPGWLLAGLLLTPAMGALLTFAARRRGPALEVSLAALPPALALAVAILSGSGALDAPSAGDGDDDYGYAYDPGEP